MKDSRGSIQRIVVNTQVQSFHKQVTFEKLRKISVWESNTFLLYLFQKYCYDEHKKTLISPVNFIMPIKKEALLQN